MTLGRMALMKVTRQQKTILLQSSRLSEPVRIVDIGEGQSVHVVDCHESAYVAIGHFVQGAKPRSVLL